MDKKVYITSKSKTFKEGDYLRDIVFWLIDSVECERGAKPIFKSKQKYKITITNLK